LGCLRLLKLLKIKRTVRDFDNSAEIVGRCKNFCYENGIVMRAIKNKMVIAPPLICNNEHIDEIIAKVWKCLDLTAQSIK